jgi:hypothetical protein
MQHNEHIIPLSIDAPLHRRQALVTTMINAGWGYADVDYDMKNKVIKYIFKVSK